MSINTKTTGDQGPVYTTAANPSFDSIVKAVDANGDGIISVAELSQFLQTALGGAAAAAPAAAAKPITRTRALARAAAAKAAPTSSPDTGPVAAAKPALPAKSTPLPALPTNTIQGTDGNDTIWGTTGNDVINAKGGDDMLHGSDGHDTIDGGAGNDTLFFDGKPEDYTVTVQGPKGTTVVKNIENLKFGTPATTPAPTPEPAPAPTPNVSVSVKTKVMANGQTVKLSAEYKEGQYDDKYFDGWKKRVNAQKLVEEGWQLKVVVSASVAIWEKPGEDCTCPPETKEVKSPIALDMNHDGKIGVTGQTTAKDGKRDALGRTVSFDIDGDGKKDEIEWMSGDGDALLVDDRDGKAATDMNGSRLFGDMGGKYGDGYEKLAMADANHDGKLTGAELEGFKLWFDDGDAIVEEGELRDAAVSGVSELSVKRRDETNARGETLMRSDAVINGERVMSEDVWFGQKR